MKLTMPFLALVVALLLVASQSIYTVEQTKYAIKFQLGEIVEINSEAGLYFKVPLLQNVRYFDRRNLTLENADVDRVVTSEKTPLEVDFVVLWRITDVKQYYVAVQGNEDLARGRLSQTVRSNLAEEFNKATMHEAISTGRDRIMTETRLKADQDARNIGVEVVDVRLRRLALPADVTGPVYARMESERRRVANELRSLGRRGVREDPRRRRPPAPGDPRRRVPAGPEDQGRRRRARRPRSTRRPTGRTRSSSRSTAASKRTRRRSAAAATCWCSIPRASSSSTSSSPGRAAARARPRSDDRSDPCIATEWRHVTAGALALARFHPLPHAGERAMSTCGRTSARSSRNRAWIHSGRLSQCFSSSKASCRSPRRRCGARRSASSSSFPTGSCGSSD